jgi:hypothetical protein
LLDAVAMENMSEICAKMKDSMLTCINSIFLKAKLRKVANYFHLNFAIFRTSLCAPVDKPTKTYHKYISLPARYSVIVCRTLNNQLAVMYVCVRRNVRVELASNLDRKTPQNLQEMPFDVARNQPTLLSFSFFL